MTLILEAPSGNCAECRVLRIGDRATSETTWAREPSAEDRAYADACVLDAVEFASGAVHMTSQRVERREEMHRRARAFLGGGMG